VSDEDLAREALLLDSSRSVIVLFFGMKGSGKSAAARTLFDGWSHDRVVIDPTGSARPDDPHTVAMKAPFGSQLPEPDLEADPPQTRVTVWARIDPRSSTYAFDQDQAMGMALHPRRRTKLIWRDEFGQGISANKTLPNDQALLMSSRHYNASALLVVQRPRHIPVIAIAQADKFLIFRLPSPEDREHVAKNAGIPVPVFERQYHDNQRRGAHCFLLYDRAADVLLNCPPLPGVQARGPAA
jgi:hypothetical protein